MPPRPRPALLIAVCVSFLGGLALARQAPSPDSAAYVPPAGMEWARQEPAAAGFDPFRLEAALEYARAHETRRPRDFSDQERIFGRPLGPLPQRRGGTNGLILRRGYLVAEFGDTSVVEPMYSAAKSMLSTVLGLAIDRGLIPDLDARVGEQVTDGGYSSLQNQTITWRHHAEQTSEWQGTMFGKPHAFSGVEEFGEAARQPRTVNMPGTQYEYNDVRVNRFALSLLRVWRKPVADVFRDEVMTPIAASATWQWLPYRDALIDIEGTPMPTVSGGTRWGGGVWMHTRDAARFGLLFERRGLWGQRQILSERWVRAATTPGARKADYGLLWWLNTEGKLWPGTPATSFAAVGFGSNTIWIDPEHEIVVVWRWHEGDGTELFRRIVSAVAR